VAQVLRAYLRLALFAVGLLAGVQVPGFVDQYSKRVSAHYIEVVQNFAGFQRTADQYFGGDIDALIAHHEASPDSVFKDEAKPIRAMYARLRSLTFEVAAMQRALLSRIAHVALQPDKEILNETIAAYSYTVPLNQEAILCGVLAGLLLALAIESLLIGMVYGAQALLGGPRSAAAAAAAQRRY
jgi:Protein of unknown function (DUF2937)